MTVTREQIVAEARRWKGTPFMWQKSVRGKGCDCRGLVWGVARDLGMPECRVPEVSVHNYRRVVKEQLLGGLEKALVEVGSPLPGDVLVMAVGGRKAPMHLGIFVGDGRMVHCYGVGPRCVIESPISDAWPVMSYWTWPSLGETRDR